MTADEAADNLRELLRDAVQVRLRSDVPVGSCLSGGVDSSSIVALIEKTRKERGVSQRQYTFSAIYDQEGRFNEAPQIKLMLQTVDAEAFFTKPSPDVLATELEQLHWHQEEPFPTLSIFAQWRVMALAKEHGVTVLLDGQGADEAFGGYRPFQECLQDELAANGLAAAWRMKRKMDIATGAGNLRPFLVALLEYNAPKRFSGYLRRVKFKCSFGKRHWLSASTRRAAFMKREADRTLAWSKQPKPGGMLEYRLRDEAQNRSLPRLLQYEDRNSMAFSIEGRTPFVDYRLMLAAFGEHRKHKLVDGWTKWIVRKAMDGLVPSAILWNREKVGFETPEVEILGELARQRTCYFQDDSPIARWCDMAALRKLWARLARDELSPEEARSVFQSLSAELALREAVKTWEIAREKLS